jgi:hypothetical protein
MRQDVPHDRSRRARRVPFWALTTAALVGLTGAAAAFATTLPASTHLESMTIPDEPAISLAPTTTLAPPATTITTTTVAPPPATPSDLPPAEMAPRPTEAPAPPPAAARRATPAAVTPSAAAPVAAAPVAATPAPPPPPEPAADSAAVVQCVVSLHGKGGSGRATTTSGAVVRLFPTGNASGWGGRQWLYFPESGYQSARSIVTAAIDSAGCSKVIVGGFSNGGAFAAKLYCRGETFGGRLVRVVVDDPVVDNAVVGCAPAGGVGVTLYWTGALESQAQPGWNCADGDWTCEGGTTIGVEAYASSLGTAVKRSPMGGHSPYTSAPELTRF